MPVTVKIIILHPEKCGIRKLTADLLSLKVQRRYMVIKPGSETEFIPEFSVLATVGSIRRSSPIGMRLESGALDVHMVGDIVEYYIHIGCVGLSQQFVELFVSTEASVDTGGEDRPVAVISTEFSTGIRCIAPGVIRILGNR